MGIILSCGQHQSFKRNITGVDVYSPPPILKISAFKFVRCQFYPCDLLRPDQIFKGDEAAVQGPAHFSCIIFCAVKEKFGTYPICGTEYLFQFGDYLVYQTRIG